MPPAIVLGLGVNGYGVARSLARAGVRVAGVYSDAEEYGRYSKYCEVHYLPSSLDEERGCRSLIELGAQVGDKPVLLTSSDHQASILARHRETLSSHFRFHWIDAECVAHIVDKAHMSRTCRAAGVLAPGTHVTRADESVADLALRLPYPCLIKPNRSFETPFPSGLKNFVAGSRKELLVFYRAHPELMGVTVCQDIIEGGDENIFQCTALVRQSGEIGAVFCARKLHQYRPGYGVMCFGRSEENEVVATQALRLLRALPYRGLASLEFKYRAADARYYFIEMNPRLPWYSALFYDADVNLPYLTYLDLTQDRRPEQFHARQRNGIHWVSFKLNLGWLLRTRRGARIKLASWLRSMAQARSYAWFDRRDFMPFLRATMGLLGDAVRAGAAQPRVPRRPAETRCRTQS